jgi:phage host-nuclease inhibitor protein Gam
MSEVAKVATPRNASQAAELLRRIGETERAIAGVEGKLAVKIGRLTAKAREMSDPLKAELAKLDQALEAWAIAHREELLPEGKKSFSLATGELGWKTGRPKVELPDDKKKLEAIIAEIRRRKLEKLFLRVKTEVDKQGVLKHPDDAKGITGLKIVPGAETFYREAIAAEIQKAA